MSMERPKRPLSSFNLFYRYKRNKVLEELARPPSRRGLGHPGSSSADAEAAALLPQQGVDRTEIPFITIDPPGSMDSNSSVLGKGERGAPCPPCSPPMPCMGAPPQ